MAENLQALWDASHPVAKPKEDIQALWDASAPTDRGPHPGLLESAASGAGQGLFGAGDEAGALLQAILASGGRQESPRAAQKAFTDTYRQARFENRQLGDAAREQHPGAYYPAMLGSAAVAARLLPQAEAGSMAGMGERLLVGGLNGGAQGAAFGAGSSNADLTRGETGDFATDVAKYGLGGGALGVAGGLAGEGLGVASRAFGQRAAGAADRAQQAAIAEQDALESAAQGSLGSAYQKANRMVENLQRLRSTGNATPDQLSQLQELEDSGLLKQLEQKLLGSNLRDLPGQGAEIDAKQAVLDALQGDRSGAIAEDAANRLDLGRAVAGQVVPRLKRYALNAAGSAAGALLGGPGGAAVGGLAAQNFRPVLQSFSRMARDPAVAYAAAKAGQAVTGAGASALGAATSAAPALERDVFSSITDMVRSNPQALGGFAGYFKPDDEQYNRAAAYALQQTSPQFAAHMKHLQEQSGPSE